MRRLSPKSTLVLCPMTSVSGSPTRLDLDEVLKGIDAATQRQYKDKDGRHYTDISIRKLRSWHDKLTEATQSAENNEFFIGELAKYKDMLTDLTTAADAHQNRVKHLEQKMSDQTKDYNKAIAHNVKTVNELQSLLAKKKAQLIEADAAKTETIAALKAAEAMLEQPEAKFLPEKAKLMQEEISALRADLKHANDISAFEKAEISSLNKQIDSVSKTKAGYKKQLDDAVAELSTYKKQVAASRNLNVEMFNIEEVSFDDLVTKFGTAGVDKLRKVLDIQTFDVRGRISALTGFFHVVGDRVTTRFKPMVGILRHALDILKNGTGTLVAVLAPWVNLIVKDIVCLQIKGPRFYRTDLEMRIKQVKAIPFAATPTAKLAAAQNPAEHSWKERLRSRAKDMRAKIDWFKEKMASIFHITSRYAGIALGRVKTASSVAGKIAVRSTALILLPLAFIADVYANAHSAVTRWFYSKTKAKAYTRPASFQDDVEEVLFVAEHDKEE